ncbi:MAG: BREX-1 system adenine-specific DNA-methyltransferase PglX [Candidatus Poseidonia sp.]|nr:BREX-1 system adenine-specific DNA-methyltransferase PglX [Poseidonia sp.]
MQNGVSGWYARLDRCLTDRREQIDIWLKTWETSLKSFQPIAALLPEDWPTLPANLLTDPGHVLDHLLARHDAESDGRSPRGAHPTPPRLADAVITSEMREALIHPKKPVQQSNFLMSNLPPGFRQHVEQLNLPAASQEHEVDNEAEMLATDEGRRTLSGIPLPVADTATGGGLFHARLIRRHADAHEEADPELKKADTRRLFSNIQLLDIDTLVVESTKVRLLLESIRHELVSFGPETDGKISRVEMEALLEEGVKQGDALQGEWPWEQQPRIVLTNPPWLRIKDRFRGMEDGSRLRKELGEQLRSLQDNNQPRFSTMRGNVNLYRLFIERSLQILESGGRLRMVVPDSLLREQSSHPLRELLVNEHAWTQVWAIEEANLLFPGMTQGVVVLGITANGEKTNLTIHGPITRSDLRRDGDGVSSRVPQFELKEDRWVSWARDTWAVPRLPRDRIERKYTLEVLDRLAQLPRLSDEHHPLTTNQRQVRVRVGEIDQTAHAKFIETWVKGKRNRPFIRGVHFSEDEGGAVFIRHPAFRTDIPSRASERQLAMWTGDHHPHFGPRLACQAIVNAHQDRRLRWAVISEGSVLGNSVNHIELHEEIQNRLTENHGTLEAGLGWLCTHLNNNDLDEWARAWAANNNVNNYELEMLPVEMNDMLPKFSTLAR